MHELSIAMGIVKIAENACNEKGAKRVDVIELEIGELSGIEGDCLDFVWPMAVKDTKLQYAEKVIDWVKGKAKCLECGTAYPISNQFDGCPKCNAYYKDILEGKELKVKSLVVS